MTSTTIADSERPRVFVEAVRSCLHQKVRVELSDGRIVEGTLDCYDDSGNMILAGTTDVSRRQSSSRTRQQTYRMGTVLVPGHVQVSIKVLRTPPSSESSTESTPLLKMQDLSNALDQDEDGADSNDAAQDENG